MLLLVTVDSENRRAFRYTCSDSGFDFAILRLRERLQVKGFCSIAYCLSTQVGWPYGVPAGVALWERTGCDGRLRYAYSAQIRQGIPALLCKISMTICAFA